MLDALLIVASEAAAAEGGGGGANAVIPKLPEIWPAIIGFLILFFVLAKFALPPLTGMLEKRAETIRESLERAEDTRVEAEKLLEDYRQQMAEARAEASKVIEQGRKVAESMRDEILAKADSEASSILAKAREEIGTERKAAVAQLQAQVADLSVAVAGKIIGEKLSAADHEKLIEGYLAEVGGLNE